MAAIRRRRWHVDELVTSMNRAAEQAVLEAKTLLVQTAKSVTLDDALCIVRGSESVVTEYFHTKTRQPLGDKFMPIVKRATERVALAGKYNAVAERAAKFGLVKSEDADLQRYGTGKTLDGLYLMIGEEERKIRRDPVGTGSATLNKVFGASKASGLSTGLGPTRTSARKAATGRWCRCRREPSTGRRNWRSRTCRPARRFRPRPARGIAA